ncbi:MAG TPA: CotH kinase family protein, partial [Candidatus Acidoferrum sp.]|nr:CotH kinase family protein [Candidatus Acidoferrum sp.]
EGFIGISTSTRAGFPTGPGGFPADPKGFQPAARVTRSSSSSSSRSSRTVQIITNHFGYGTHRALTKQPNEPVFQDDYEVSMKDEENFKTTRTNEFYFVEPEPDEITAVQKVWLKRHLNELEAALYGPDFKDAAKGYRAFIDPDSFIDYHMIVETTKNVDGFRFSVFFSKDRGGKIKAEPIWDWNLSFGNANGKQGWLPEYWLWPQLDDKELSWYRRLFEDPDFGQRYVDRWSELRTNVFSTPRILARIDEIAATLQEAQKRNFEKWPILGRSINPNYFVGSSYEDEVNWMKKFIATRLEWIEKQFPPAPALSLSGPGTGRMAQLAAAKGEIYFTLNGADPRAGGGKVAEGAQKYHGVVPLPPGQKLFARTLEESRWSGPLIFLAN